MLEFQLGLQMQLNVSFLLVNMMAFLIIYSVLLKYYVLLCCYGIVTIYTYRHSLIPRPRQAFRRFQYGKVGGAWERGYVYIALVMLISNFYEKC